MLRLRKVLALAATILGFFLSAVVREIWMAAWRMSYADRQRARSRNLSKTSRNILAKLGFRIDLRGDLDFITVGQSYLAVSNHLSFWDVLAISSYLPLIYITSVEVKETPLIGRLAAAAGSRFVERRGRSSIQAEVAGLSQELSFGQAVGLFPEATSTNGDTVLPFKNSFFASAISSGCPVVPICIEYLSLDGVPVDRANRDLIFYYGDQNLLKQIYRAMSVSEVCLRISILPPILPNAGLTRAGLAELSHRKITEVYHPPQKAMESDL